MFEMDVFQSKLERYAKLPRDTNPRFDRTPGLPSGAEALDLSRRWAARLGQAAEKVFPALSTYLSG
jgi:hypothetical protein